MCSFLFSSMELPSILPLAATKKQILKTHHSQVRLRQQRILYIEFVYSSRSGLYQHTKLPANTLLYSYTTQQLIGSPNQHYRNVRTRVLGFTLDVHYCSYCLWYQYRTGGPSNAMYIVTMTLTATVTTSSLDKTVLDSLNHLLRNDTHS